MYTVDHLILCCHSNWYSTKHPMGCEAQLDWKCPFHAHSLASNFEP